MLKHLDWQMIMFVGFSLVQDYWNYYGLPQVYYWEMKEKVKTEETDEDDDNHNAA